MAPSFAIAHVTPYPWEVEDGLNVHVAAAAAELSRRGHRVLVLAPSRSQERVRESRKQLRAARGAPERLLEGTDGGSPARDRGGRGAGGRSRGAPPGTRPADRRRPHRRGSADAACRSTSCTCTSRSPPRPRTRRCATRGRSTSARSTPPASGCSRRWSPVASWRASSGASTPAPRRLPATAELMARTFPAEYELVPDDELAAQRIEEIYLRTAARRHGGGDPELAAGARGPSADRGRPAHAHRPLLRLRDAGGGAAGERPRGRASARSR